MYVPIHVSIAVLYLHAENFSVGSFSSSLCKSQRLKIYKLEKYRFFFSDFCNICDSLNNGLKLIKLS